MSPLIQSLVILVINLLGRNLVRIREEREAERKSEVPSASAKPVDPRESIFKDPSMVVLPSFRDDVTPEPESAPEPAVESTPEVVLEPTPVPEPSPAPEPTPTPEPAPVSAASAVLATPQILVLTPDLFPGPGGDIARSLSEKGVPARGNGALNVVAIRNSNRDFDVFKCRIAHLLQKDGEWIIEGNWAATTYPGKHYTVDRLLNPLGVAILALGKYSDIYELDLHRGIYEALCQRGGKVRVHRDGNRDRVYDLSPNTIQNGMFGINVHATQNPDGAPKNFMASRVHSASAGCLVFAAINDFVEARIDWRAARSAGQKRPDLILVEDKDIIDFGDIKMEEVKPQIDDNPKAWFPEGFNTVGVRNRNLLNVKGDDQWLYSLGQDSKGHHKFPSFPKGLRAGIVTLRTYWTKRNLRTIADILARWAPATDTIGSIPGAPPNSPKRYSEFVAGRMGIKPTDKLMTFNDDGTIRSADQIFQLVAAMVANENDAKLVLPRSVFDEALSLL